MDLSTVLPLGVDYQLLSSLSETVSEKEISFCTIGAVKERKGALYSIKAIDIIKNKFPNVKLYIIGRNDNKYAESCKDYVKLKQLQDNIEFLGPKDWCDLPYIYNKCIANILHSVNVDTGDFEGFGLIHLEANCCNIPTIGTYDCGNETAIINGINGFLTKQKDVNQLSSVMEELIDMYINNRESYDNLCKSSKKHAESNSWKNYYKELNRIYKELI